MHKKRKIQNGALKTFFSRGIIVYVSVGIILMFIFCAVFADKLSPYDPNKMKLMDKLNSASLQHIFGCDTFGRDVLTRLMYGARVSLIASLLSGTFAACTGMLLGLLAGFNKGILRSIILRYVDLQLSIPPLLFTIIIGLFLGHGMGGLIIALGFGMIPSFIRLMYSVVLSIKNCDYIVALRIANVKSYKIVFKHLLPNSFPPMITLFTMNLAYAILLESTISFLGIGIQQPTASWGNMVSDGCKVLLQQPLLTFMPGICVALLAISFNIIGDSLRDAMDPRLKGKL